MTFAIAASLRAMPLRRLVGDTKRIAAVTTLAFAITTVGLLATAGPTNAWSE